MQEVSSLAVCPVPGHVRPLFRCACLSIISQYDNLLPLPCDVRKILADDHCLDKYHFPAVAAAFSLISAAAAGGHRGGSVPVVVPVCDKKLVGLIKALYWVAAAVMFPTPLEQSSPSAERAAADDVPPHHALPVGGSGAKRGRGRGRKRQLQQSNQPFPMHPIPPQPVPPPGVFNFNPALASALLRSVNSGRSPTEEFGSLVPMEQEAATSIVRLAQTFSTFR
jgi:hypothetical protein